MTGSAFSKVSVIFSAAAFGCSTALSQSYPGPIYDSPGEASGALGIFAVLFLIYQFKQSQREGWTTVACYAAWVGLFMFFPALAMGIAALGFILFIGLLVSTRFARRR